MTARCGWCSRGGAGLGCIRVSDCSERTRTGRDACEVIEHKWFSTLDLKKMEAKEVTPPYKPNVLRVAFMRHCNRIQWLWWDA